jgi:hypothetical protein
MPTCFVLMPFDDDLQDVYDYAILPAAVAVGFDCRRADHADAQGAIISDIIKWIFNADVIVADLTRFNPNVFYELGVAHSVGNKTVMICQNVKGKFPFDLNAYRTIFYSRTIGGIEDVLKRKIEAALRGLDRRRVNPTNPVQDFRPLLYAVPLQEQAALEARLAELEQQLEECRLQNRKRELREILFSFPEVKAQHLRNLAADTPFRYVKIDVFLEELRHLRGLRLIRCKPGATIGGLPEEGDLKDFIELDPIVREVLRDIARWLEKK